MDEITWNKKYQVGVPVIDHAHQKLFALVSKLVILSMDETRSRFACEEGIKYFKNYALKHFAQEEAYMKKISYIGYEEHKRVHDNMRDVQLPSYEKELTETDFSYEAIQHFLGFCIGWLTGHIMTEDRDITRRKEKAFVPVDRLADVETFGTCLAEVFQDLFGMEAKIASTHYEVDEFGEGIYYCLIYRTAAGERVLISLLFNEQLVLKAVNEMPGIPFEKIDNVVLYATRELTRYLLERVSTYFQAMGALRFEKEVILDEKQFRQGFNVANPYCSILFETRSGPFAICVNK